MSASRIPALSPIAAKPNARLQEVVDLPTPPFPEAIAITCLTPGMPGAFEVARAFGSGGLAATACSLRSKWIAILGIARAQIILCCHDRRALRSGMGVKAFVHHGFDPAVRTHLDDIETLCIGALEHPVLLAEF